MTEVEKIMEELRSKLTKECCKMELTVKNLKEMSYDGSKWVLEGKEVEGYKSWGLWNKYNIVSDNEVIGTLEYKVGDGFVVIMGNEELKLRQWQEKQAAEAKVVKQIWTKDNDEHGMVIDVSEVEDVINLYNMMVYRIEGCDLDVCVLNDAKQTFGHIGDDEDLEAFFKEIHHAYKIDFPELKISRCGDEESPFDELIYDATNGDFAKLSDFDTVQVYRYWDGHNWVTVWADDCSVSEDIEIDKDSRVCLDEWDGHNLTTGGIGNHQCFYKIISLDDEPAEDQYLLVWYSQWQGVQDEGEIMNIDELKAHLESIDRKVEEYI
jgi:hypothetical protein